MIDVELVTLVGASMSFTSLILIWASIRRQRRMADTIRDKRSHW